MPRYSKKSSVFNKEILLENIVGIICAMSIIVALIVSSLWLTRSPQDMILHTNKPLNEPKKEQTLQASSVSNDEIEKIYEQRRAELAAKKAAEEAAIEAERKRIEAEKEKIRQEKQRIVEEKRKAEAEKKRKAEAEKKRKAEAEKKRKAEAEKKRKAEAEKKRKAEAERQRIQNELAAEIALRKKDAAIEKYSVAIADKIRNRWEMPRGLPENLSVKLSIIISASGAVKRASPLPLPKNPDWALTFTKGPITLNLP